LQTIWDFKEYDHEAAVEISRQLQISTLTARLLVQRGIRGAEEARSFLYAGIEKLTEPGLMRGMAAAVVRITKAIASQEKVIIYGDYDVDGICSIVILRECLELLGGRVDYYVPNRFHEGYGLNKEAVELLARQGCRLLITVDCGITAVEETQSAVSLGMDVIITDHHNPPTLLPPALAIINPKTDALAASADLAGAGVAFKLAVALGAGRISEAIVQGWLELAALATVADIVPLMGENRILVKYGLQSLENTKRPGLQALLRESDLEGKPIQSWQVGFILAPRLNSAGRMDSARASIELLIGTEESEAALRAARLCQMNDERRMIEDAVYQEALGQAESELGREETDILVVGGQGWHLGVIGIVASRLTEVYNRPAIVISWAGDSGRGSARSVGDFDIYAALQRSGKFLLEFGGHRAAAGLSINRNQLSSFKAFLQENIAPAAGAGKGERHYQVDMEIEAEDIHPELMREIDLLRPFGAGNPQPRFVLRSTAIGRLSRVGKKREHLRFLTGIDNIAGINFNREDRDDYHLQSCGQDLLFELDRNDFNGKKSLQLKVQDFKATYVNSQRSGEDNNFLRLLQAVQRAVEEIEAGRPVLFVYPGFRSLQKHQAIMQYYFNKDNLQPLHGHLSPEIRGPIQNQLASGRGGIYLITRAFLQYYLRGRAMPENLRYMVRMWPLYGPDHDLSNLNQMEIITLEQDQQPIFYHHPGLDTDAGRVWVYANLAKTVEAWQTNRPGLHIESGLKDMSQRRAVHRHHISASAGGLLSDGTHTAGRTYINTIDELVLADSPLGLYELAAFTDYLPARQELRIGVAFDRASLDYNRKYLQRLYPDQDTVDAVRTCYLHHAAKLGAFQPDGLVNAIGGLLAGQYSRSEILATLRILADLGLCRYEKSGSISAIILSEAEISAHSMAGTPYHMEGLAEKEILSAWEMQLSRVLGW
jgi:single-stranded-DNA-specific exonuclease